MIAQQEYDKRGRKLNKLVGKCAFSDLTKPTPNDLQNAYELEWEWCAHACANNRLLDPTFHDFLAHPDNNGLINNYLEKTDG